MHQSEARTISVLRGSLLILIVLGILGLGAELLLLGHIEDLWQWVPLVLMGLGLIILAWHAVDRGRASVRSLQGIMILFVVSGFIGFWMHYQTNAEFELEMYPTLSGLSLFWEALQGATPALAPGAMIQLGLLGLAYTYRHPALRKPSYFNGDP